jgi:hypothetical protein
VWGGHQQTSKWNRVELEPIGEEIWPAARPIASSANTQS